MPDYTPQQLLAQAKLDFDGEINLEIDILLSMKIAYGQALDFVNELHLPSIDAKPGDDPRYVGDGKNSNAVSILIKYAKNRT